MNIYYLLEYEEGFSNTPYICTEGYVTIGYGSKLSVKGAPLELFTLTVSKKTAQCMLEEHLRDVDKYLSTKPLSCTNKDRYTILQSMCYQLGSSGLNGFKNMWKAIENSDWEEAAKQALDSKWARQTPERANRHAEVLRIGSLDKVYNTP